MEAPIHLLYLEDDPNDAELVQATLAEAGLAFLATIAQTRDEFAAALNNGRTDIILADYKLPMFDGMSALHMARTRCPEVPFIFVSGTMGEEAAIMALTRGATDYVLKQNLSRLAAAIERALQEARNRRERRQAQEALQRSNEMLRAIIEAAPVAIFDLDLQGLVHSVWNPAAEKMLGWSAKEVMGRPLPVVLAGRQEEFRQFRKQVRDGMTLEGVEVRWQRRDGTPVDCCIYASPLHDAQGLISGNISVLVDIAERKRAEAAIRASEARYIDLYDNAPDMHASIDANGALIEKCNRTLADTLGFPKEEIIGRPVFEIYHPDCMDQAEKAFQEFLEKGELLDKELQLRKRDGSKLDVSLNVSAVRDTYGAIIAGRSTMRDITERKLAETRLNEQLHFLQQLIDSIPVPVYYKDTQGVYLGCNVAFEAFFAIPRKDIVGKTVHELVPKERADRHHVADLALLSKPGNQIYEVSGEYKDGRRRDVVFHKATFVDANNRVAGTVGTLMDITERKAAERERLANLEFFESMDKVNRAIQGTDDLEEMMKLLLDEVLSIFDCDRAYLMYPCDPEAPTWRIPMERSKPEYFGIGELKREIPMDSQVAETIRILLAADGPVAFGPGTPHTLPEDVSQQFGIRSFLAQAIFPKTGSPWQFGIHQCTHARAWTAKEMRVFEAVSRRLTDGLSSLVSYRDLRQNEQFLDNVVEHIPNMIFVKDARTLEFVRFNKAGEQLLGYSRNELLGKTDHDFFPGKVANFFETKDRQVIASKEPADIPEEIVLTKTDAERILHTKKIPILDPTGTPQYLLGISEDITERKQAEASIRKLSQVVEQSPVSIVITNAKGSIEFVNAKFSEITGYSQEEALGQNPRILKSGQTPAEEYSNLWQTIISGGIWRGEFQNRKKNGELFWEHATIAPVRDAGNTITHYVAVKEDITERKRLEDLLRQVQKMEAIGQLAGGIAHDFNNILSAITGYTEISKSIIEPGSKVYEYLAHVLEASGRAKELINQILTFSRETEQELRPIQVRLPVREALKLIRASVPANIEIYSGVVSQASALADSTQIHQIVMNLCTNAAQAMQDKGGLLDVRLTDVVIDDADGRKNYPDAKPGQYIRLSISDQGHGIEAHHLHRIFDPFFTTKEKGKGTGMGLSVVHGIVKSYGGSIYVHSRPGIGSAFEVLIPALESKAPVDADTAVPVQTGSESILCVDDEVMLADIAKGMLESLGYRVAVRTSSLEALEAFRSNPDGFDLLVTDLIMPKMSGLELAEKIQQIRSNFPVILCTGFGANIGDEEVRRQGVCSVIYKPILRRDIAAAVRKILDGR